MIRGAQYDTHGSGGSSCQAPPSKHIVPARTRRLSAKMVALFAPLIASCSLVTPFDDEAFQELDPEYCADPIDAPCDDLPFCGDDCRWSAPDDWVRCDDGDGNPWYYLVVAPRDTLTWDDASDRCVSLVDSFGIPERLSGLAIAHDDDNELWTCLIHHLDENAEGYYIGLRQYTVEENDNDEPSKHWSWVAQEPDKDGLVVVNDYGDEHPLWNENAWFRTNHPTEAKYDLDNQYQNVTPADCIRLEYLTDTTAEQPRWHGLDLHCSDGQEPFGYVCMVTF